MLFAAGVLAIGTAYYLGFHNAQITSNRQLAELNLELSQLKASQNAATQVATGTNTPTTNIVLSPFSVMFPYSGDAFNFAFNGDTVYFKSENVAELALKADPNNNCNPATLGMMTRTKSVPQNITAHVGDYYYSYSFPQKCTNDAAVNAEAQTESTKLLGYLKSLKAVN